jgi:peroxiredoxin
MLKKNWLIAAAMVLALAGGSANAQIAKGKKAPDFSLKTLDGKDFKLKPLVTKGADQKKVVILAFWGSWCPPCRAEAPHLQALYAKNKDQGVDVVGVAVQDEQASAQRFVDFAKLTYTVVMDTEAADIGAKYGAPPIPRLYVLDRNGTVRFTHLGYGQGAEVELEKEIKGLLKEKSKP